MVGSPDILRASLGTGRRAHSAASRRLADEYRWQPSLVNGRKRAVVPALLQRQQLADALARYLGQLAEMALTKAAGVTDLDFPFLSPDEAKRLQQLQAKVDTGEIDVLELYRLAGPIFKAEQAMMARRQVS